MELTQTWLRYITKVGRAGTLKSKVHFAVSVNGSSSKENTNSSSMELTGTWLRDNTNFWRCGTLKSKVHFAVSVNGSSSKENTDMQPRPAQDRVPSKSNRGGYHRQQDVLLSQACQFYVMRRVESCPLSQQ